MTEQTIVNKVKKGAKKTFFEVRAPFTSSKIHLYGSSAEELVGRVVKLDLTRSLKGKNFEIRFRVALVDNVLEGLPISIELVGSYIRRMMRTGIDYVEDSFVVDCKDGKVRVKPFMITRKKVSRSVRRELRNVAKKFLDEHLRAREAREVFSEITANKIQKEMFLRLKKIYPLALCEVRTFELVPVIK